jgi:integrase
VERLDLDLDNRVLYVRQQTLHRRGVLYDDDPKSRRRRVGPLPALCIAPLLWHRLRQAVARAKAGEKRRDSDYVFTTRTGHPVEPRNIYRSFTRIVQSVGLGVIQLHDARHGTATLPTAAGVAPRVVTEILGHSQISITMDVYTQVVQDTQREAMSHMDRLLRRRPGRQLPHALMPKVDVKGPGPRSVRGLLSVPPAGFEPATPALGERVGASGR